MAKLSDIKKVELLETAVINNDIANVKKIFEEHAPIEFTAKALGLACRFCGPEMVETLIAGGATFDFDLTPTLQRKYDCKIKISNSYDIKKDFLSYLLSTYTVDGYSLPLLSDEQRKSVLKVLMEKNVGDFQELLYHSILFDDAVIYNTLVALGVNSLSDYRIDIVSGRVATNRLDSVGRYERECFQYAKEKSDDKGLLSMLGRFLECMDCERYVLFPSDLYEPDYSDYYAKDKFIPRFCSEVLFDFFVNKTNMTEKVKAWELIYALVDNNNAAGLAYALEEKWISKAKDLETLLNYVKEKTDLSAGVMAVVLDKNNQVSKNAKKPVVEELTIEDKPLSAAELKKIWGTKKLDDGSLIITSYKGEAKEIIIPSAIGKQTVTAISAETFDEEAPRISEVQKKVRKEISYVEFPGSIKEIPEGIFKSGWNSRRDNLKTIVLNDGIQTLSRRAFVGCTGISEITIPSSVKTIGNYTFEGCSQLKRVNLPSGITELPGGMFSATGLEEFTIPKTVTDLGTGVFSRCQNLRMVVFPENLKTIPNDMFAGCRSFSMAIPDGVETIGYCAFQNTALTELTIPASVSHIGMYAFSGCEALQKVNIPSNVAIDKAAFEHCDLLANEKGQIVVNGIMFGMANVSSFLSPEMAIKPTVLGNEISSVSAEREHLPEIVYREYCEKGDTLDVDSVSVGETVSFGHFPENTDYTMMPLNWKVIAKEEDKILLITEKNIMGQSDKISQKGIWKDSWVRKLLNEGFYMSAFTDKEREQIILSKNTNPRNKSSKADGGPDTEDFVFLLSLEEVEKYLPEEESRKTTFTDYAKGQYTGGSDRSGHWVLRTPGSDWGAVGVSDYFGRFSAMTGNFSSNRYLRPAIWVKTR